VEKVKNSKSKSSKSKSSKSTVYPCYIVEDHQLALSGVDAVKITKRNNTLIRFIGCNEAWHGKLQPVPASQLRCFAAPAADDDNNNNNKTDSAMDAEQQQQTKDGADGSAAASTPLPQWDPERLQQYLESIQSQQTFADPDTGALQLRAERLFLDLFLQFVWDKQQTAMHDKVLALQQQQTELEMQEEEEGEDDDVASNCDDTQEEPAPPSENSNPVTQDSGDDGGGGADEEILANAKVAARRVARPDTLRAGDEIRYWCVFFVVFLV